MAHGPISEEDIRKLMESEEGQAILQEIMASESSGESVGGNPTHMMPDGSGMPGTTHVDPLDADYTPNIYEQSPDMGNVPMVTGPGPVQPMTPEELEKRRMIEELLRAQGGSQMNGRQY